MSEIVVDTCLAIQGVTCYEILKDFIGPIVTIIVAFFSVRYAFAQINSQHANALSAQKEEAKLNTKIELFKNLNSIINSASEVISQASTFCMVRKYSPIDQRKDINFEEYHNLSSQMISSLLTLVSVVESNEIASVKLFKAFRYSLQAICYDLMELQKESDRELVLDRVVDLANDSSCYIYDFQICLQNLAYSDIFEFAVPHRVPNDPALYVITNNEKELDEFIHFLQNETAWGKSGKKYNEEAKAKFRP